MPAKVSSSSRLQVYLRQADKSSIVSSCCDEAVSKSEVRSTLLAQHPGLELCAIYDCEAEAENPVEAKYRKLAHDKIRGVMDPNLKVSSY